jgi:tight adherence protein C
MIMLLIAGIGCFALSAFQLSSTRRAAARDRRAALATVRATTDATVEAPGTRRTSVLLPRATAFLAGIHTKLWRRDSPDDINAELRRAGVSGGLTAERFMAIRVAAPVLGALAGFTLADGSRKIVLALVFGIAGVIIPRFLLSKAATRRADTIDGQMPHFVDQLAIAIEAGMSLDAALTYLQEATDGPLADELNRIMTELRVGSSRKAALKSFADRVGSDNASAFVNAVLASDQLGSPLADILRAQAADFRHRRQMNAEERAQKAPVKMLFPIAIFILPVMFVVILAPAFLGGGIF